MATEKKTPVAEQEKTVRIKIPKTKEDMGDVFVSVNERTWQIQRGVYVDVPECVAEVLEHQEEMNEISMMYLEKKKK